ncbi:bifunctional [glutamine synthetase] adenylyltransferase/[glutamine synthetase]-adenylyl-L-tyrosine phosphorylase [Lichenihabitans sp. Uapishka_5]|uniref:bifunctional [glutamine synthetase] adenylyltransferase/[glutamine synthetase]-adenylyl-L-tyrosine phosphorylase n=1 Tax=Lichenihabitans sp. Uapishka_5 TaxID=3037302 RepID=UPI0029E80C2A|nr:bifunctional [glutamine synthetase] adenylyltransferase/[glutamine synthetase]-adenylyl-L-tyrosine phosphorylase [Lichenihabitans sp. Uapishka_5]MDX7952739.1 bifunctional [glutamine synthetase] adenylyltransferase/[glutamine synthetase]-adenylyl-L-tyrosine phosphorylase [Lichenihabitans sp. Uapishka_5]
MAAGATLADALRAGPRVADPGRVAALMTDLRAVVAEGSALARLIQAPVVASLLAAVADHSPYLWRLVLADPGRLAALLTASPEATLERGLATLAMRLDDPALTPAAAMPILRRARQEVALLVALADLGAVWSLEQVTGALTRFAEAAVGGALAVLVREAAALGRLRPGTQAATSGLTVLALGKAGGRELNYSSDIDLVVVFDPAAAVVPDAAAPGPIFVRLTQALVRLLQDRTGDGFVLRVDLRLRPDPASTPVAIALPSAFSYYETLGQNWERAAFIKARPVAGDRALGDAFLRDLEPFIWRKYFDYAAIADIHAMKRQIHAVRGQGTVAVAGQDVKLGRGGIREIEFFVQTQQLIFGGRRPALRGSGTVAMLAALAQDGWIDAAARDELGAAYRFLRSVEHRLQMIGDQQTHRLPDEPEALARFAAFMGFADEAAFTAATLAHQRRVQHHYARLFEDAPDLAAETGSLVFTGTGHDPATLETLARLGFARPADASELVRGWHFGRRPAVRTPRAREVLTELVPALLQAFSRTRDPDGALGTFDTMLGRMTAAGELLALLRANAELRAIFADILGSAPRLAATVAQRPHVLDVAIDPTWLDATAGTVRRRVATMLDGAPDTEGFLDRMRDGAREDMFLAGLRALTGVDDVAASQAMLSDLADALIAAALERARADLAGLHGGFRSGACVVLGMGRLGSREMTIESDLDLVLLYRTDPEEAESDGPRPLDPGRYHARLTQRLIAILTSQTRRGGLYAVDLRLRPSGRQGPVAVLVSAFAAYQKGEAAVWEHMALTRARVVAGDASLTLEVECVVAAALQRPRDAAALDQAVVAMRTLVARERGEARLWDMKNAPGGLIDIEFLAQAMLLGHAARHPSLCRRHPALILTEAGRLGLLAADGLGALLDAHRLQATILHLLRFMGGPAAEPQTLGRSPIDRLCRITDQPDLAHLEVDLLAKRAAVRQIWDQVFAGIDLTTG